MVKNLEGLSAYIKFCTNHGLAVPDIPMLFSVIPRELDKTVLYRLAELEAPTPAVILSPKNVIFFPAKLSLETGDEVGVPKFPLFVRYSS